MDLFVMFWGVLFLIVDIYYIYYYGIEGFENINEMPPKNAADITENQDQITNFTGLIKDRVANLQTQLDKLDKEIKANTASIKAAEAKRAAKLNDVTKQQDDLKKKMAAITATGQKPPPWVGVTPPLSMMPIPIT